MLAKVQQNLGYFFMSSNRPQDAERAFREALKLAQKLADESPAAPVNQSGLGSAFHDLGTVLVTRDPAEASRLFEKAIDHQKTALNANPNSPVYRRNLSSHYSQMCEALLKMRDHKAANKAALAMTDFGSTDSQTYTLAASIVAQCVPLAENDTRLIPEKRQEAANAYKQGAMNVLKTAVRLGFKDVDVLKDEPAFASLHGVEEYKLLLKELENAKKP
jgi:tetratricopeptide (TPR) repeat protein